MEAPDGTSRRFELADPRPRLLSQTPPVVETVLSGVAAKAYLSTTLEPTTPAGPADAVWMIKNAGGQLHLGLLAASGAYTERFAIPATALSSPYPAAARDGKWICRRHRQQLD